MLNITAKRLVTSFSGFSLFVFAFGFSLLFWVRSDPSPNRVRLLCWVMVGTYFFEVTQTLTLLTSFYWIFTHPCPLLDSAELSQVETAWLEFTVDSSRFDPSLLKQVQLFGEDLVAFRSAVVETSSSPFDRDLIFFAHCVQFISAVGWCFFAGKAFSFYFKNPLYRNRL